MLILTGLIGLLIFQSTIDARRIYLSDNVPYNPCGTLPDVYFYAHPADPRLYYQCDESGNAYERSCDSLVWDDVVKACNWQNAVIKTTALPTESTTRSTTSFMPTPTSTSFITFTRRPPPPSTSTVNILTTESITTLPPPETTLAPAVSLCQPINPCGAHGQCLESFSNVPTQARRFVCICDEDWFGRLCDKRIDEVRLAPPFALDQSLTSTSIEGYHVKSTVSSESIIVKNPEIILGGFSGILPPNAQNRFEGNRRRPIEETSL